MIQFLITLKEMERDGQMGVDSKSCRENPTENEEKIAKEIGTLWQALMEAVDAINVDEVKEKTKK